MQPSKNKGYYNMEQKLKNIQSIIPFKNIRKKYWETKYKVFEEDISIAFTITQIRNKYTSENRETLFHKLLLLAFIAISIQLLFQFKNSNG